MKKLLYILLLAWGSAFGQVPPDTTIAPTKPAGFISIPTPSKGYVLYNGKYVPYEYVSGLSKYVQQATTQFVRDYVAVNGGVFTSDIPVILNSGKTLGKYTNGQTIPAIGKTPQQVLLDIAQETAPPTAVLNASTVNELTSASTQTTTVTGNYGRLAATTPILSASIAGQGGPYNVFTTSPGAPGNQSFSQSITYATNTTTTYTLTVTATDGKTATDAITNVWYPRRYWGRTSNVFPTQSEILAIAGGGSDLSAASLTRLKSNIVVAASGSNRPFFAYINTAGAAVKILDINGFDVTSDFRQDTQSFTNVNGNTFTIRTLTLNSPTLSTYTFSVTQ